MDINRLSYFISVAKHLNFTKAANECYIAQTAMSRHILALEDELGVTLFYRNNRNVVLTPAGEVFFAEALIILEKWKSAIHRTKVIAQGYEGSLRIGFGPYEKVLVTDHIKHFLQHYPNIEVVVKQYTFKLLVELLNGGLLDLVYSMDEFPRVVPDSISKPLAGTGDVRLVLDWAHPLAKKKNITFKDLAELEFVYNSELGGPTPAAHFLKTCNNYGFSPKRLVAVNTLEAKLIMVHTSKKACLLPAYKADTFGEDEVCVLHLPDPNTPPEPCYAVSLSSNSNPAVELYFGLL